MRRFIWYFTFTLTLSVSILLFVAVLPFNLPIRRFLADLIALVWLTAMPIGPILFFAVMLALRAAAGEDERMRRASWIASIAFGAAWLSNFAVLAHRGGSII